MEKINIVCPNCGANIDLTQAVQKDFVLAMQEEARKELQKTHSLEIEDLRQQLESKSGQLDEAHRLELKLRQQRRELDEKLENQELEIERRIDEERKQIAKQARSKIEDEYRLKLAEKDTQLERVIAELDAAKKKAEQGSQQLQGEVAELALEDILNSNFPYDRIEPVGKGAKGADVLQYVHSPEEQACGIIIWESKRTKNWSDRWIPKLKGDQLKAKAEIAILVSVVLPDTVNNFDCFDGVWITIPANIISLATIFREYLIQLAKVRRSIIGKDEKIELLYRYLSGPEFRQRVEMIVNTFMDMKTDLEKEKTAMIKQWSQREKSIEKVRENVAGMYGDLQGIIGKLLPSIPVLELPEGTE